jgi:hypothetical protein
MKGIAHPLLVFFLLFCSFMCRESSARAVKASVPIASVETSIDREYGYYIGDLVNVSYKLVLPPHHSLNHASLPKEHGSLNNQIDIKKMTIVKTRNHGYPAYQLTFVYQVFASSDRADFVEIPEIKFSYGPVEDPSGRAAVLPRLRIVISPLAPEGASFKPAIPWARRSLFPGILWWAGALCLLVSSLLLFLSIRKRLSTPSPFTRALKELSKDRQSPAALILFRSALNQSAGKAIFASNLEELFRTLPGGTRYRDEIREMILLSDEVSFNPESHSKGDNSAIRIRALLKKLRRVQRWA